jgi:hypothetical protein
MSAARGLHLAGSQAVQARLCPAVLVRKICRLNWSIADFGSNLIGPPATEQDNRRIDRLQAKGKRVVMGTGSKILLLEFNEISWHVIDKLVAQRGVDFLPNFRKLREQGAWAVQSAIERPPLLDPWITWVTLHTGVRPEHHGASVLEQSADTITAKRTWQYASDAGRSIGVFGSVSSYPPEKSNGFMVPGPFAPTDDTFPANLRPVQSINRRYTQVHAGAKRALSPLEGFRTGAALIRLGLRARTVGKIVAQIVQERVDPHIRWKRVCLQPELNFDIFSAMYRKQRPDFSTWHSNHAAHFMHHYWRAWDDSGFAVKSSSDERAKYGEAVPYGYRLCDELLGRAMRLVDDDTVLVLASSMGQQPFVSDRYAEGKIVVRIKDIEALLDLIGRDGITDVVPTMVPQWNITVPDAKRRARLIEQIEATVRRQSGRVESAFAVQETHDQVTITPLGLAQNKDAVEYDFVRLDGRKVTVALNAIFAMDTPTVKQGMHHVDGLLAFWGAGVKSGVKLPPCTNLDAAPTMLTLMGLAPPAHMPGNVLEVLEPKANPVQRPS